MYQNNEESLRERIEKKMKEVEFCSSMFTQIANGSLDETRSDAFLGIHKTVIETYELTRYYNEQFPFDESMQELEKHLEDCMKKTEDVLKRVMGYAHSRYTLGQKIMKLFGNDI